MIHNKKKHFRARHKLLTIWQFVTIDMLPPLANVVQNCLII